MAWQRSRSKSLTAFARFSLLLVLIAAAAGAARAQEPAQTANAPEQPQSDARYQTETGGLNIPPELDPRDPNISKEERIRRHRLFLQERRRQYQERKAAEERQAQPQNLDELRERAVQVQAGVAGTAPTTGTTPIAETLVTTATLPIRVSEKLDIPHVTFFLTPASQSVRTGEQFATEAALLNPDHLPFDRVRVALRYPSSSFEPVAIHQDTLKPLLKEDPSVQLDSARGTLVYEGLLKVPVNSETFPLITVVWAARQAADSVEIQPLIDEQLFSGAWAGERLVSMSAFGLREALAGATVRIMAAETAMPAGLKFMQGDLPSLQPILAGFSDQSRLRPPTLWFDQPDSGWLEAGQWLVVDLGLDNPDGMVFDEIRLAGRFDPEAVEIHDADELNWISRGVNLLDGPFHAQWPWDLQFENTVNNAHGTFYYRMGMTQMRRQPSGVVARILARVKRRTPAPVFSWVYQRDANPSTPSTGVFLMGENVYLRGTATAAASSPDAAGEALVEALPRDDAPARLSPPIHEIEKADPAIYRF